MISLFKNIFVKLTSIQYKFLLNKSLLIGHPGSKLNLGEDIKIVNSKIIVYPGSVLTIANGCIIRNVKMFIKGKVVLGEENIIESGYSSHITIIIDGGSFQTGYRNRIRANIWQRFNSLLTIGNYNNINEESEIRADEKIEIGDFNQISYKCNIWDTNTHNIYSDSFRRELTKKHFPIFGYEFERPKTRPIFIGSDCWIGREASILKGVTLNNSCIVAYKTTLSNCNIEENHTIIAKSNNILFSRKAELFI